MYNPEAAVVYDPAIQLMIICGHFKLKQTCVDFYLSFVVLPLEIQEGQGYDTINRFDPGTLLVYLDFQLRFSRSISMFSELK